MKMHADILRSFTDRGLSTADAEAIGARQLETVAALQERHDALTQRIDALAQQRDATAAELATAQETAAKMFEPEQASEESPQ